MKIDTTKIDGYEAMTPEQKVEALMNYELEAEKDTSELDKLKKIISDKNSESADWKRKYQSTLTEQEKEKAEREEEIAKIKEEYETLKREQAISKLASKYVEQGYPSDLANETASAMYSNDFDKVMENNKKFFGEFEKNLRADITKNTPKPDSMGGSSQPKTRESILSIKDSVERQKAIAENIELFEKGD